MIISVKFYNAAFVERARSNKKGTLAGTILKKYKDVRMNNSGTDRVMQYSI